MKDEDKNLSIDIYWSMNQTEKRLQAEPNLSFTERDRHNFFLQCALLQWFSAVMYCAIRDLFSDGTFCLKAHHINTWYQLVESRMQDASRNFFQDTSAGKW